MDSRYLSIWIEQRTPGCFWWTLMETTGADVWFELAHAAAPESSWTRAYAAGCAAMGSLGNTTIFLQHGLDR